MEFTEVLTIPGASVETPTLTADNKKIYFTLTAVDSDIWLMAYDEPR